MCQLNLYIFPQSVPKEKIISVFEKYNMYIKEDTYYRIDYLEERYEFYSTTCHCDCNSIISRLQDENVSSFDEYKIKKKNEDIEELDKMKKLKTKEDYVIRVKEFENKRDKLWEVVDSFNKNISDFETEELGNNKEYRDSLKEFQDFITENADLQKSTYYNISDFEKTIDEYDFSDFLEQLNNLKNIYEEILKFVDEICIYPFWQDGEPLEIKGKRQVMIKNLNIEDLTFLPYRNLLRISASKE